MNRFSIIGGYEDSDQVADLADGLDAGGNLQQYADKYWMSPSKNFCTVIYPNLGSGKVEEVEVGAGKFVKVITKEQLIEVNGKKYQAAIIIVDPVDG